MVVHYCLVPKCENNSLQNRNKIFIRVPQNNDIRKTWFAAINYSTNPSFTSTKLFCCEDHFNLQEDCENFTEFKTIGGRLRIKKNVVPHLNIDVDNSISNTSQITLSAEKRKEQNIIAFRSRRKLTYESGESSSTMSPVKLDNTCETNISSPSGKFLVQDIPFPIVKTVAIQANIRKPYRSKAVGTDIQYVNKSVQTNLDTFRPVIKQIVSSPQTPSSVASGSDAPSHSTYYEPSSSSKASDSIENKLIQERDKNDNKINTLKKIENHSRFYLGLPQEEYFLIRFLSDEIKINYVYILITIKKMRLNDAYFRLGVDFGLSQPMISKIFNNSLPKMANELQDFIYWPDKKIIKLNLPTTFIRRYSDLESIIDCFEIQIEAPTNATHQAQTWSNYKKCNTAKYLISSAPFGLVNFVSKGFGGRTSDREIIEKSRYLDELSQNCTVMADRGFKSIENLLHTKNCRLVRPPSVFTGEKPTKEQVMESKRIAALRIHIERLIRRIREFKILTPHACVNHELVPKLDYMIIIVCAIINTQGLLIQ